MVKDWSKPIRFTLKAARNATNVRFIERLKSKTSKCVMLVVWESGDETHYSVFPEDTTDLENVPEKIDVWVNLYRSIDGNVITSRNTYPNRQKAEQNIADGNFCYLDTVKIWEEEK